MACRTSSAFFISLFPCTLTNRENDSLVKFSKNRGCLRVDFSLLPLSSIPISVYSDAEYCLCTEKSTNISSIFISSGDRQGIASEMNNMQIMYIEKYG